MGNQRDDFAGWLARDNALPVLTTKQRELLLATVKAGEAHKVLHVSQNLNWCVSGVESFADRTASALRAMGLIELDRDPTTGRRKGQAGVIYSFRYLPTDFGRRVAEELLGKQTTI